ncbi:MULTISPECIES: hypothetical protein [Thermoleptolyngbya]|nr:MULTISPECIES: hypothetical protein [Thermoleptolyngbya]
MTLNLYPFRRRCPMSLRRLQTRLYQSDRPLPLLDLTQPPIR